METELAIGGAFFLFWMLFILLLVAGALAALVFWVYMLIDAIRRDFENEDVKILWILVLVFAQLIGAILYYFMVKNKDDTKT